MKKIALLSFLCILATTLHAQIDTVNLLAINQHRLELNRIHAYVLGAWAVINLLVGGYLTYVLYDGEPESFHHMNASWGLINLGVAWLMLYNANYADPATYDLGISIHKHFQTQKLMMLNLGLDVTYTLAGVLLREHGKNNAKFSFVLKGFGRALILQGSFLLALDGTFYTLYSAQNDDLYHLLWQISCLENSIRLIF